MKINKKYFFLCQKLQCKVSFIRLKPILDIFLHGFRLSSCPHHSLKVLLLLNLLKYVLNSEKNFFIFLSGLTGEGLLYCDNDKQNHIPENKYFNFVCVRVCVCVWGGILLRCCQQPTT
jgi:hypothetical protein